jgi:DNA recombination protein RmuC
VALPLVVGGVVGVFVGVAATLLWSRARLEAARRQTGQAEGQVSATETRAQVAEARLADVAAQLAQRTSELDGIRQELLEAGSQVARLSGEVELLRGAEERRLAEWSEERERLSGAFSELSQKALRQNADQFLQMAGVRFDQAQQRTIGDLDKRHQAIEGLLVPLREQLGKYEMGLAQLELNRKGAYTGLVEQVKQLSSSHEQLQRETHNLATALRAPSTRGRWGELQLRRVVEMAGMVRHCDFAEQESVDDGEGRRLRPDMIVHLPGGSHVVVDAKVPYSAFVEATEAGDEDARSALLVNHARQVRNHVDQLSKKEYWRQFDPSPEFVVAFIPGDPLLAAAFEHDPGLLEYAVANHVLLATPTTLIALLRTVAYGWQQQAVTENAREVQQLGRELYRRIATFGEHLGGVGKGLNRAVESYNKAVGSLERSVLPQARRFNELGVAGEADRPISDLEQLETSARALQSAELGVSEVDSPALPTSAPEPFEVGEVRTDEFL